MLPLAWYSFHTVVFSGLGIIVLAGNIYLRWGLPFRPSELQGATDDVVDPEDDETASKRMIAGIYGLFSAVTAGFRFYTAGH